MNEDFDEALFLEAHPTWSWRDLQETPEGVLCYLDAFSAARAERTEFASRMAALRASHGTG